MNLLPSFFMYFIISASKLISGSDVGIVNMLALIVVESDIQTINLDLNSPMATNNDSLGIELLADPKKSVKVDGYSSGEEKAPSPKKEDFNLEYNTYMSHIRYTSRKKFKRQHDKILDMAIMKACSDHYDDFSDNNLANFIKTYVANQSMNG